VTDTAAAPSPAPTAETPAFSPMAVLWIILAGVFSFSAFVVLSAYAPDLRKGSDGGAHALSRSAVGYAGIVQLLQNQGVQAVVSRNTSGDRDPDWREVVLTPGMETGKDPLTALTKAGPTIVVLPKWLTTPSRTQAGWVDKAGLIDGADIAKMLAPAIPGLTINRREDTAAAYLAATAPLSPETLGPIDHLQTLAPNPGLKPLMLDARGGMVVGQTADRHLVVISDPDILNTQGLADIRTARVASDILTGLNGGDGPIIFDVSLNGFGTPPNLLKLAFSPPYLGATLCLLAAGLLMGLHAASRFGAATRARRAIAFGKRALADNSAGLIRMARREHRMAGRYLDLNRAAVVAALGITRLAGEELDAFLDKLAAKSGIEQRLADLVPQARAAKNRADLMRVARGLYQWRVEMIRERR
jgi:hypothetical protein